jgi:hypothetical protein
MSGQAETPHDCPIRFPRLAALGRNETENAMKVLISWSGERSKLIALALHKFLKRVIQATEPWVSDKDIGAGAFWHEELWGQLSKAEAGIICVTPEMKDSTWVHFEAGALANGIGKVFVTPYLFDLKPSDVQGPLAFLQCVLANRVGTLKLIQGINDKLGDKQLSAEDLRDAFDAHWPSLEEQLKKIPGPPAPAKKKTRPIEDVLDEILSGVRVLQATMPMLVVREEPEPITAKWLSHELRQHLSTWRQSDNDSAFRKYLLDFIQLELGNRRQERPAKDEGGQTKEESTPKDEGPPTDKGKKK